MIAGFFCGYYAVDGLICVFAVVIMLSMATATSRRYFDLELKWWGVVCCLC
jgi:hypothetical protein